MLLTLNKKLEMIKLSECNSRVGEWGIFPARGKISLNLNQSKVDIKWEKPVYYLQASSRLLLLTHVSHDPAAKRDPTQSPSRYAHSPL